MRRVHPTFLIDGEPRYQGVSRFISAAAPYAASGGTTCYAAALPGSAQPGEYQNSRMTLERPGEDLRPLDTQTDAIVLDGRNGGLGNAGQASQLALAQLLEFTKNAHRLTDRDGNTFFWQDDTLSFTASDSHAR